MPNSRFLLFCFPGRDHAPEEPRVLGVFDTLEDARPCAVDALLTVRDDIGGKFFSAHLDNYGMAIVRASEWRGSECLGQFDFITQADGEWAAATEEEFSRRFSFVPRD